MFLLELDYHCVFHSLSASLPYQALRASSPKGRAFAKQKAGRTGGQVCVSRILFFFAQSAVPERPALRAGKAEQTISRFRRSCFYSQSVPDGRVFLSAGKALFRSNPDGLQGEATQDAGKKAAQTVCNGYESNFKIRRMEWRNRIASKRVAGIPLQ